MTAQHLSSNSFDPHTTLAKMAAVFASGDAAACLDLLAPADDALPCDDLPPQDPAPDDAADQAAEPDPELVGRMAGLFRGRTDAFARQVVDARGAVAWYPVKGALTEGHLRAHLRGEVTLGVYPHLPDDSVHLAAIDLDVKSEYRNAFTRDAEVRRRLTEALTRVMKDARARLGSIGLPALAEDSGYKGRHLWLFFASPVPARTIRRLLQTALSGMPLPREFALEVFPKSDRLDRGQIGNLIKLPLGIHRGSGRRAELLGEDGAPGDPQALLAEVRLIDPAPFLPPPHGGKVISLDARRQARASGATGSGSADDAHSALLAGCPVVASLAERAARGEELLPPEAHVLIYALGVLGEEGKSHCRALLAGSPGHDEAALEEMLNAVPPTAIGCHKIRKRLRGLIDDGSCACRFDVAEGIYPSPVIHAGYLPRASGGMIRPTPAPIPAAIPERAVETPPAASVAEPERAAG